MKSIKNLLKIIFVAAIGSATWEFVLRDRLLYVSNWLVGFFSSLSPKYKDFIYSGIHSSDIVFVIFPTVILLGGLYWVLLFHLGYTFKASSRIINLYNEKHKNEIKDENIIEANNNEFTATIVNKLFRSTYKFAKVFPIITMVTYFLIIMVYTAMIAAFITKFKIKRITERNIIVVRPFISESNFHQLNSEYYQVDSKIQFIALQIKMDSIGELNKINIINPID